MTEPRPKSPKLTDRATTRRGESSSRAEGEMNFDQMMMPNEHRRLLVGFVQSQSGGPNQPGDASSQLRKGGLIY